MNTLQENGLPPSPAHNIPVCESTAKELGVCGTPIKTKEKNGLTERSSPVNHVTAEFGDQLKVPSVNAPAPSTTPLGLPGVMDAEGRVDESRLRMHIFKNGGVSPSERGPVWRFLFGMYPCSSTSLERPLQQEQLKVRYHAMKRKWQQLFPAAVRLPELVAAVQYFDVRQERVKLQAQNQSAEVRERLSFLELQAQVHQPQKVHTKLPAKYMV
ncbi:unnamed protein product [Coregonus sp. 'balchen']|nr:unnamed protein product [Coregonus sp. 'balchen']